MANWNRKSVCIGSAAIALAFMLTGSVGAFFNNHENKLTFSRAVMLPHGIVLPAGTYSFNVANDTADDLLVIKLALGGNLSQHHHHTGLGGSFTGNLAHRVLLQTRVQNGIGDLITDFVRMSFSDRFRGK